MLLLLSSYAPALPAPVPSTLLDPRARVASTMVQATARIVRPPRATAAARQPVAMAGSRAIVATVRTVPPPRATVRVVKG